MDGFCSSMENSMGDKKRHGVSFPKNGNSEAAQAAQICSKPSHKTMELWEAQVPTTAMAELYTFVIYVLVLKYSVCQWSTLLLARYSEDIGRQECWTVATITLNSQKPKLFQNHSACLQKMNSNIEQICRYIYKLVPKLHKQQWKLSMLPSVVISLLPKNRN